MNPRFSSTVVRLLLITVGLVGCSEKKANDSPSPALTTGAAANASTSANANLRAASAPAAPAALPAGAPVAVTTAIALARDLAVRLQTTGSVFPLASVDIKAQTNAVVTKMHIHGGQFVRVGDPLFSLDARADEANLAKARAQLAKDQATLSDAQRQLRRAQDLLAQNFVAQSAVDSAKTAVESASATVLADQAAIDAARVLVSYSQVNAPLSGRAGALNVSLGTALQSNITPLVTITQLDPIAVSFNLPQRNLADALAALKAGGAKVTATLADNGGTFEGRLNFVDNAVDPLSGTVKARAEFPNPQGRLWPGAFVEISQTIRTLKDAVIVPQAALVQSARGSIVYVVENGTAVLRPVKQVAGQNGEAAVTGIAAGEIVVVEGKQNLRPGAAVLERAKEPKSAGSTPTTGVTLAPASGATNASATAPARLAP